MELAVPLGTPLGLSQWKRGSSRGEAGTSDFLSVSDSDIRVRAELGQESQATSFLRNGTPLASRVVLEVTGHLSSCVCNLPVFQDDAGLTRKFEMSHVGGATCRKTPISRSALEMNPMPGHLFEGNPVGEGTKHSDLSSDCEMLGIFITLSVWISPQLPHF